jgi:hypothetical protein
VKKRFFCLAVLMLMLCMSMTGCFFKAADELYCLPEQSEEYNDLQRAINQVMVQLDASYAAPVSGSNQQAVQLADLDGDGNEEAVAFLKTEGNRPLKLVIFQKQDESYTQIAMLESDGSNFSSVEYLQIDGQDGLEVLVGRQIGEQVPQSMGVYALQNGRMVELMSTTYQEYTTADLDLNGMSDIVILSYDAEERNGVVERYCWRDGQLERDPEVLMSNSVDAVKRIITGYLQPGVPAVFVASVYQDTSILTDIFAVQNDTMINVTAQTEDNVPAPTVRNYFVYATDIDDDGLMELPDPQKLPYFGADGESENYIIHWYNMELNGQRTDKLTTYHNYSSGWYLLLPDWWENQLTVTRGNELEESVGYIFSKWESIEEPTEEVFTLYEFSGYDRQEIVQDLGEDLVVVGEKGEVIYAAKLAEGTLASQITDDQLKSWFHFISVDWNTGEVQ